MGGVLVDPAHNLHYVDGSLSWAGVMPMAIIGVSRAFHIDLTPYLSEYGKAVYAKLEKASIANVLAQYPGLTWAQLAKPEYPTPESHPGLRPHREPADHGHARHADDPAADLPGRPRRARRDGGQQAGDRRGRRRDDRRRRPQPRPRVLRRKATKVHYTQYPLGHIGTAVPWIAEAMTWMNNRFLGLPAPQNCASIEPGNSLAPIAE